MRILLSPPPCTSEVGSVTWSKVLLVKGTFPPSRFGVWGSVGGSLTGLWERQATFYPYQDGREEKTREISTFWGVWKTNFREKKISSNNIEKRLGTRDATTALVSLRKRILEKSHELEPDFLY